MILKPTDGSLDNLELLRKGEADVAFVRGGSANRSQQLMRMRVLLQFLAIVIIMGIIWWRAV